MTPTVRLSRILVLLLALLAFVNGQALGQNATGSQDAPLANAAGTGFSARPFLFKAVESRLRASISANDAVAVGPVNNSIGVPLGFLSLARAAAGNRAAFPDIPTFQIAFAGWLRGDEYMLRVAHAEAMKIVTDTPKGDAGNGDVYQHVEYRLLNVAATADLAFAQFSPSELAQVATWVNGTLSNWNTQNIKFWPNDDARNNYWQNGFLAHVIGGITTEGFNPQASSWRNVSVAMANKYRTVTNPPHWSGPLQSEGHYYAGYVKNALWAMELYDAVLGTKLLAASNFNFAQSLNLLMFQTRPHLLHFFAVGSEANQSSAPFTQLSFEHWHHLIHSGQATVEARQAKAILDAALAGSLWSRASKGFASFYWNLKPVNALPLSAKPERMFTTPTPGAGLIALRSASGFQTNALAAIMFANKQNSSPSYSHGNPDAPGFQWASGTDWLVTDPEFFSKSGILAESGSNVGSDVSNIVTLAGHKASEYGEFPVIKFSEYNASAPVPHAYVQIDAQPYWTAAKAYRRDYVWLDDLQVVVVFDRVLGGARKTWRLHVSGTPTVDGKNVSYSVNGKAVTVRDLFSSAGSGWAVNNLNGSLAQWDVWRISQLDDSDDYRSLKVLDVGGRVTSAAGTAGAGYVEAFLTIAGNTRVLRFFDDGRHASIR